MRKRGEVLGTLLMVALTCLSVAASPAAVAQSAPVAVPAKAYLLMDANSGQVLHEHAGRTRLPMASTTKVMTAMLALERGNLADVVTAGRNPYNTGGSTIYLELGERQTLRNLLYALMLESANDAAVAVAEHLAGTEEAFAALMNQKAREIGALDTNFVNSHGLHHRNHYSTAYDLALIARYALRNPTFREIAATEEATIPGYGSNTDRSLYNRNRLVGYYEGATGVKNGFTEEAGLTNVASARRGDTELIAVVLGAEDRLWTSSMALLDYGFKHYRSVLVAREGEVMGRASVAGVPPVAAVAAADLAVTVFVDERLPERRTVWEKALRPPLKAGDRLGRLELVRGEAVVASVDLVAPFPVLPGQGTRLAKGGTEVAPEKQSFLQWVFLLGIFGLLLLFNSVMRRRGTRSRQKPPSTKPHGRDRLYEIRNRRRL